MSHFSQSDREILRESAKKAFLIQLQFAAEFWDEQEKNRFWNHHSSLPLDFWSLEEIKEGLIELNDIFIGHVRNRIELDEKDHPLFSEKSF